MRLARFGTIGLFDGTLVRITGNREDLVVILGARLFEQALCFLKFLLDLGG